LLTFGLASAAPRFEVERTPFVTQTDGVHLPEYIAVADGAICDDSLVLQKGIIDAVDGIHALRYAHSAEVAFAECMPLTFYQGWRVWSGAIEGKHDFGSVGNALIPIKDGIRCREDEVIDWSLPHILGCQFDVGVLPTLIGQQLSPNNNVSSQRAVFLIPRDPSLPAGETRRTPSSYQSEHKDYQSRLVMGVAAVLAAFGLVGRGVWHGVFLIREGSYLFNSVSGVALVVAGIAALWVGIWLLFPLTASFDTVEFAEVASPAEVHYLERWEGGEV